MPTSAICGKSERSMRIGWVLALSVCGMAACASVQEPRDRAVAAAPARVAASSPKATARRVAVSGGRQTPCRDGRGQACRNHWQDVRSGHGSYAPPVLLTPYREMAMRLRDGGVMTAHVPAPSAGPARAAAAGGAGAGSVVAGEGSASPAVAVVSGRVAPAGVARTGPAAAVALLGLALLAIALWRMLRRRRGERSVAGAATDAVGPLSGAPIREAPPIPVPVALARAPAAAGGAEDASTAPARTQADAPGGAQENQMLYVTAEQAQLREALAIARNRLAADDPERALEVLLPYAELSDTPPVVLLTLASAWKLLGEASDSVDCFGNSADALVRIKRSVAAEKIPGLAHGIGRCRLEQARRLSGSAQRQALDRAVEQLNEAAAGDEPANPHALMDQGAALLLRAAMTEGDRVADLEAAEAAFRRVLQAEAVADSGVAWWLQLTLRQLADAQSGERAAARRAQARAIVADALARDSADAAWKAVWQASAIQLAIDEVRADKAAGVAKRLRLKEIQRQHRALLAPGAATPVVFAWVKLLAEEGKELIGRARRETFVEAKRALDMAGAPANPREEMELRLLTAFVARQRGSAESKPARATFLAEAEKALEPYLPLAGAAPLRMEAAMVALEQAGLMRPAAARLAAKKAMALAEPLFAMFEFEAEALRCYLKASLLLDDEEGVELRRAARPRIERLIQLAPADAQNWVLAARHALAGGDSAQAARHCEAAARSGASEDVLRPLRQQIGAAQEAAAAAAATAEANGLPSRAVRPSVAAGGEG